MPAVYTEIRIQAPLTVVWDTLTDLRRYPDWNPLLRRVVGRLRPDDHLWMSIHLRGFPSIKLRATVRNVKPEESLDWTGCIGSASIYQGHHQFRLFSENGTTVMRQWEEFSGAFSFLAYLALPFLRRGFNEMNLALKHEVEAKCARVPQ